MKILLSIRNNAFVLKALLLLTLLASCKEKAETPKVEGPEWVQLFNGKDLTGWTPKITGHPLGTNFANTFSVKDGFLTVGYDQYDGFKDQFGHLFYEKPFSAYYLAVEYRFIGDQISDGPEWAYRNSGAMLHSQDPETMVLDQDFPISVEAQMLGGNGTDDRPTSNLCTPGTHVVMNGELYTPHCINSSSKTYHGDQWVRATFLVLKDSLVQHFLEGDVVLEYSKPQIGGENVSPFDSIAKQDGKMLTEGYISLQSESSPIQFRKVELVDLNPVYSDKSVLKSVIDTLIKNEKHHH